MKSRKAKLHRNQRLPRGGVANKRGVVLGLETGESSKTGAELREQMLWAQA